MLPELVWNMPPMGTVNLHGSLLPQYRGAAPINWAIIHGEKFTGVTTFKLQHEIDTGDILLTATIPIGEQETAGELHDKMKEIGAELLLETVKGLSAGDLMEAPQIRMDEARAAELKIAPKIFTASCQINWNKPVSEIYNLIRGLSPYPAAFSFLEGKKVKIFKTEIMNTLPTVAAGEFETDKKTFLYFAGSDGYISLLELQLEGKKKMEIADFLRGYRWA
jgi:methionyl-tRNA formyltransferase